MRGAALYERRRSLVTPEGVDLSLRLADAGQRAGAFIIDLLLMIVFLIVLGVGVAATMLGAGQEVGTVFGLLGFFLLRNFYFTLMELGPRAATFGKRWVGLRVVARSGGRLTADAVIARNLTREIEFYLPLSFLTYSSALGDTDGWMWLAGVGWTLLFLFFPLFNEDRLRVGDLLAGTWVINTPRKRLAGDLVAMREAGAPDLSFTPEQLDTYGVYELQTLEQVLRQGNDEAVTRVAAAIRGKIGWAGREPNPVFLNAYYQAARLHMERELLFGKRRADKHDR